MYKASMSRDIVKKKAAYPIELTEMQRRFCEYLIMNEGRTTRTEVSGSVLPKMPQGKYRLNRKKQ